MNQTASGMRVARPNAPIGKASMQTPTAARCRDPNNADESMCVRGKFPPGREVSTGSSQVARTSTKEAVATPVNSARNLLQGVLRESHHDPWLRVTMASMAPSWAARNPSS